MGHIVSDRWGQLLGLIGISVACIMTYASVNQASDALRPPRYITGAVMLFVGSQMLESINMSLLSKLMPKILAQGFMNSGFLLTEFGMDKIMFTIP